MKIRSRWSSLLLLSVAGLQTPLLVPAAEPPSVFTLPAGRVTTTAATLRGMVNPRGEPGAAWFEWGETTGYGSMTTATNLPGSTNVIYVAAEAQGVMPGRRLHCRLVVSNSLGVFPGPEQVFGIGTRVVCWGIISNAPPGLRRVTSVAAGKRHNVAVRNDGALILWDQTRSEITGPANATNIIGAAAGLTGTPSKTVALRADGSVTALMLTAPSDLSNAVAVAAESSGTISSAALLADGQVRSWASLPYSWFPGISNLVAISARESSKVAVRDNSTAMGTIGYSPLNIATANLTNLVTIAAGVDHVLALRADGSLTAWGSNSSGQTNVPAGLTNVVAIACGDSCSLALRSDGTLAAWGRLAGFYPTYSPAPPAGLSNVIAIAAGQGHCVAVVAEPLAPYAYSAQAAPVTESNATLNGFVTANGFDTTAWFEWGLDTSYGDTTALTNAGISERVRWLSQPVSGLTAGQVYHCRLVASNQFGTTYGADRRFGVARRVAVWEATYGNQYPTLPSGLSNLVDVAGGLGVDYGLKSDGTVVAWGSSNSRGEKNIPGDLNGVVAIESGGYHCLALRSNGTVVAWGDNRGGQTNVPAGLSNVVAISAGGPGGGIYGNSLALLADGTLVRWGDSATNIPRAVADVVAIGCGGGDSAALCCDGTVAAWGYFFSAGFPPSPEATNLVTMACGDAHGLAIRADGRLFSWGINTSGQTDLPSGLTNAVEVAGGVQHSLAFTADGRVVGWGTNATLTPAALVGVTRIAGGWYHSLALCNAVAPIAKPVTASGYANTGIRCDLSGLHPTKDPFRFRITSLPATGSLEVSVAGVWQPVPSPDSEFTPYPSANTLLCRYTPPVGTIGSPYTAFTYVTTAGGLDSAPAVVSINVTLPSAPVLAAGSGQWTTNGEFALRFTGNSSAGYRVFASTNLVNWEPLGFATNLGSGQFEFREVPPANQPVRFYRPGAP